MKPSVFPDIESVTDLPSLRELVRPQSFFDAIDRPSAPSQNLLDQIAENQLRSGLAGLHDYRSIRQSIDVLWSPDLAAARRAFESEAVWASIRKLGAHQYAVEDNIFDSETVESWFSELYDKKTAGPEFWANAQATFQQVGEKFGTKAQALFLKLLEHLIWHVVVSALFFSIGHHHDAPEFSKRSSAPAAIVKAVNCRLADQFQPEHLASWRIVRVKTALNVRVEPSRRAEVFCSLHPGTVVHLLNRTPNRDWSFVEFRDGEDVAEGWVYSLYLRRVDFTPRRNRIPQTPPTDKSSDCNLPFGEEGEASDSAATARPRTSSPS